jgi:putative resolvase
MTDGNFVRPAVAAAHFGVDVVTLRRWATEGFIRAIQVPGPKGSGHRRYDISSMHSGVTSALQAKTAEPSESSQHVQRVRVGYCRVSSIKQRDDLNRQVEELRSIQPPLDEIVTDIGSGLNYKRKNFQRLIARVTQNGVSDITVAYRDRLCRFGSELVEYVLKLHNCSLTVLHEVHEVSDEQELARDLMDIVHVFSCRRNGRRRYAPKFSSPSSEVDEGSDVTAGDRRESEEVSCSPQAGPT